MIRLCLIGLTVVFIACSPNRSILEDRSADSPSPTATPINTPSEVRKFTVAELMNRVAHAPPDSFLFPCTLNSYSDESRLALLKLREQWLSKEQDPQYLVAPSTGCVCPSICVLLLENAASGVNDALLALDDNAPERYYWLSKDVDLSHAALSWDNSIPKLTFKDDSGADIKICSIEPSKAGGKQVMKCTNVTTKNVAADN